jgi:uncharacterized phage protein gp47/JayE
MATFPTPSQIELQYKQILKSIKPSLNTNDANSDFIIRGKAFTGIASGLYGDQQKVRNDTWVSSARPEAVILHGLDLGIERQPATSSIGSNIGLTGVDGTVVNPGDLTFLYVPTNILYTNTTGGTVALGVLVVEIEALVTGQIGNILAPDSLQIVSPPTGIDPIATIDSDVSDGSDIETIDSLKQRILNRKQSAPAGGNQTDYPNFAFAASDSVRSAFIRRFGRGLGTVDIYITTGTTDIDSAVTNGLPIVRIPSPTVIAEVQTYYNEHVPLTDCPRVYAPAEEDVNATIKVVLASGLTLSSVPADPTYNPLNLTVQALIQREVQRVIYKLPVGGRVLPGSSNGFVVAADIEEGLDVWLSAVKDPITGVYIGKLPILEDRQCQPLDGLNINKQLSANALANPDVITITVGV